MEPDDPTTLDSQDDRAAVDLSRRRLLIGAAAGALSVPLLRSGAAAATSALSGDGLIREPAGGTVSGGWDWRFKRVRDEFIRNFTDRGEVGAAVSVIAGGRRVIDLWGGVARPATGDPWQQDTIVHVWSCTKGATALCAHILAARGLLDLDALVTDYWPEFGQNGKEATTVAMLLSHQAGVPAIRDPLPAGAFYDTQFMTDTLAAEAPFWEPGSRHGYHALTFGFLVGELVRRISGKTLGEFFRAEVADRFGIDFQMGLPDSEVSRLATVTLAGPPPPPFPIYLIKAFTDPTSIPALVLFNNGGFLAPGEAESPAARAQTEIGASGGFTNARALARMYQLLVNPRTALPLVGRAGLVRMSRVNSAGLDQFGYIPSRFGLGYVNSIDSRRGTPGNQDSGIVSEDAFLHSGFGGSIGLADPRADFSLGYVMNQHGNGTLLNPRGQSLVDAAYKSLGYVEAGGNWVRPIG
ncbi:MAG: beta-lactamase family protein [Deltaproteobacteria bacterium]|nr:MAG: beta-lactamase family protein [Deltaproteobacteria bacterium]